MVNEVEVLRNFTIENWLEVVNSTSPLEVWTDLVILLLGPLWGSQGVAEKGACLTIRSINTVP